MLEMAKRMAQRLSARTLEHELRQVDDRFFTELDEGQAEIRIEVQQVLPDFVKHRRRRIVVAPFEEQTNKGSAHMRRTDGIAKRDPRAPFDPLHQQAAATLVQ